MKGSNHADDFSCARAGAVEVPRAARQRTWTLGSVRPLATCSAAQCLTSVVVLSSEVFVHIWLAQLNVDLEPSMTPAYRACKYAITRQQKQPQRGSASGSPEPCRRERSSLYARAAGQRAHVRQLGASTRRRARRPPLSR
jgi:hypothetical protein